jgi:hypothetical protein
VIESALHRHFRDRNVQVEGTRELFSVAPREARERLRSISGPLRVDAERTDRLFHNPHFSLFLFRLFQLSGLYGNLDIQGSWTLSVLPQTNGGRWFTLNIGPHEVAFSTRTPIEEKFSHYIVLDRLILEYPETIMWLGRHGGDVREADYKTAERALTVRFDDDFAKAERFYALKGDAPEPFADGPLGTTNLNVIAIWRDKNINKPPRHTVAPALNLASDATA